MKVIFLGTPDFGIPAFQAIMEHHQLLACVCQPDKVGTRGRTEFCAVKKFALQHNIPLYQFEKVSRDGVQILKDLAPDIMVTAAYGQILSQEVIDIAPYGIINIHGSLLPELRGAAPIQYAVLLGLKKTGVTILNTVRKVDAGPTIVKKSLDILPFETNGQLFERLSLLGAEAVIEALDLIEKGQAVYTEQDEEQATFTGKITAEQERIDWSKSSTDIINLVRALNPSPIAWTTWQGKRLKIHELRPCDLHFDGVPGQVVLCTKKQLAVLCGDNKAVYITVLQAENSKCMPTTAFLCGKRIEVGTILGE